MSDFSVSMPKGTPLGGQSVTLSGAAFGATAGIVTVEGRSAEIVSWTASAVTIKTPARRTAEGHIIVGDDDVAVLVTISGGGTLSGVFHYNATRLDLALMQVRNRIAQISVDQGDYYSIGPAQVASMQEYHADSGAAWPQGEVYCTRIDYNQDGQDQPYGRYTGLAACVAQFSMPLDERDDWDSQLRWLQADLFRAIMKCRQFDQIANDYAVGSMYPGKITGPQGGAMASVAVEFVIHFSTSNTNFNSITEGD